MDSLGDNLSEPQGSQKNDVQATMVREFNVYTLELQIPRGEGPRKLRT